MRTTGMIVLAALACVTAGVGCNSDLKQKSDMLTMENRQIRDELANAKGQLSDANARMQAAQADLQQLQSEMDNFKQQPATPANNPFAGINGVTASRRGNEIVASIQGDVLFDSGKTTLKNDAKKTLSRVVSVIKNNYSSDQIRLIGFTDTDPIRKSGHKTNYHLGFERAFSVGDYLATHGISKKKISYTSFGPDQPKSTKAKSRRVELAVVTE